MEIHTENDHQETSEVPKSVPNIQLCSRPNLSSSQLQRLHLSERHQSTKISEAGDNVSSKNIVQLDNEGTVVLQIESRVISGKD
jgi:hypothetical protein